MIVSPASRMLSAISFGVFCRSAPSTSAIIRSMNVWPGSAVIRILIQSDSTRVPPVTAVRSPPDSRMTGADSPVIADSSTDATPSMISPSDGMNSPAFTITTSSLRSAVAGTVSVLPPASRRFAVVSVRALRSVSACAFPRPSAIASAKLANRTVSHSQKVICSSKPRPGRPRAASSAKRTVVSTLPTSTTNITGFFAIVRGWSLRSASTIAPRTMPGSQIDLDFAWVDIRIPDLRHQQVLDDRTEAEGREKRQRADDDDDADEQRREQRGRHREGARATAGSASCAPGCRRSPASG